MSIFKQLKAKWVGGRKSEVSDQRTEDRDQRSEVRGQKTEVGGSAAANAMADKQRSEGVRPLPLATRHSPLQNRIAILGDIHANLEALNAVLAEITAQGVSRIACTGDLVGYGANPQECLKIIRDLNCPVVQGNHDFYAATDESLKDFTLHAMNAMLWTREHLSKIDREWLLNLPMQIELSQKSKVEGQKSGQGSGDRSQGTEDGGRMSDSLSRRTIHDSQFTSCLVHSTMIEPEQWHYVMKPEKAEPALRAQGPDLVFFGHTHVPSLFSFHPATQEFKTVFPLKEGVHPLEPGWKHLINPGSAGQPRDHDPRASYALFDPDSRTVEIRRVKYDIATAQKKIEVAGLPLRNADRLVKGK